MTVSKLSPLSSSSSTALSRQEPAFLEDPHISHAHGLTWGIIVGSDFNFPQLSQDHELCPNAHGDQFYQRADNSLP